MLLRSVTQHVQKQNWFAVFIDFLIVVFGVFIGVQVANWNDRHTEIQNANKMLSSLVIDLENELRGVEMVGDYWLTAQAYGESAVLGFAGNESISDEQFVISAYQTSQAIIPSNNRSTFEQMVSSGNINIAGSEALRQALTRFFVRNWAEDPHNMNQRPYRVNIRRIIPHFIQKAIRQNCGDQIGTLNGIKLPQTCNLDISDEAFKNTATVLRKREDLLMDLNEHMSDLEAKLQNIKWVKASVVQMLELANNEENK